MKRTNKNKAARTACGRGGFGGGLESLETRQLFSGVGANFYLVPLSSTKTELVCDLTNPAETVTASSFSDGVQFFVNGQMANILGNYAYMSIVAQSGNNSITLEKNLTVPSCVWAGTGNDLLSTGSNNDSMRAGAGDDTIVALGVGDKLFAGTGYTNMWSDTLNTYWKSTGTLVTHFFSSFLNTSDMSLDGAAIAEPSLVGTGVTFSGTYQNFSSSSHPLFGNSGPVISDVIQENIGDCYLLSGLGTIANADPQQIQNSITSLGDGTYAMEFYENGSPVFVRVDGELPVQDGQLFGANFGNNGCIWVPLMEKGFAYFDSIEQGDSPSYAVIDKGGFADPTLYALTGTVPQGTYNVFNGSDSMSMFDDSETNFANWINEELGQGDAIEMAIYNGTSNEMAIPNILVNDHMYGVLSDTVNASGKITGFWVRNPWGVDTPDGMAAAGHNDGQNDGKVWITVAEAWSVTEDIGAVSV